jgi:hypothetical protein
VAINTIKNSSRGLDATYNGTIIAKDVNITAKDTTLSATGSEAAVVEGKNSITLYDSIILTAG